MYVNARKWKEVLGNIEHYRALGESKIALGTADFHDTDWDILPWESITRINIDHSLWWYLQCEAEVDGMTFTWGISLGELIEEHTREDDGNYGFSWCAGFELYDKELDVVARLLPPQFNPQLKEVVCSWIDELRKRVTKIEEKTLPLKEAEGKLTNFINLL